MFGDTVGGPWLFHVGADGCWTAIYLGDSRVVTDHGAGPQGNREGRNASTLDHGDLIGLHVQPPVEHGGVLVAHGRVHVHRRGHDFLGKHLWGPLCVCSQESHGVLDGQLPPTAGRAVAGTVGHVVDLREEGQNSFRQHGEVSAMLASHGRPAHGLGSTQSY